MEKFFQRIKSGQKQTVVAYGTSLTKDGAWVPLMQEWFDEKYPGLVTVINSGGRGQNSEWGAAQVQPQVLAHSPDLVFIEFSYNDAHQRFQLTAKHCKENLDQIVKAIVKKNPDTAIVLQTMNAPWDTLDGRGFGDSAKNRPHIETYNENYRMLGRERSLPVIDNYPVWHRLLADDPSRYHALVPDGSHPNKEGSALVTWAAVRSLLESTSR